MQTVRRYAYLVVIGLVAALVLSRSLSTIVSQSINSISEGGEFSLSGRYLLYLILTLVIMAIIKNSIDRTKGGFKVRLQNFKRRITIAALLGALGFFFLLA